MLASHSITLVRDRNVRQDYIYRKVLISKLEKQKSTNKVIYLLTSLSIKVCLFCVDEAQVVKIIDDDDDEQCTLHESFTLPGEISPDSVHLAKMVSKEVCRSQNRPSSSMLSVFTTFPSSLCKQQPLKKVNQTDKLFRLKMSPYIRPPEGGRFFTSM